MPRNGHIVENALAAPCFFSYSVTVGPFELISSSNRKAGWKRRLAKPAAGLWSRPGVAGCQAARNESAAAWAAAALFCKRDWRYVLSRVASSSTSNELVRARKEGGNEAV